MSLASKFMGHPEHFIIDKTSFVHVGCNLFIKNVFVSQDLKTDHIGP